MKIPREIETAMAKALCWKDSQEAGKNFSCECGMPSSCVNFDSFQFAARQLIEWYI